MGAELARRLERAWRVAATGASFALFGSMALAIPVLVYPVIWLGTRDRQERELRTQRAIHRSFRFFVRFMRALRVLDIQVRDAEALRQPGQLLVANHPTLLDVVMIGALIPQLDVVVKREAWSNPFMGALIRAAGYVRNDLGETVLEDCARRLEQGRTILLFPEGTRSPKGGLGPFRRGTAHLALRSGAPLRPLLIRCEPPSLMRGQRWYEVPERRMQFSIEVGSPLELRSHAPAGAPRGSASRAATAALRDFYEKRLQTL